MAINNPHVDLWLPAACASVRNDSRNNSRKKPCPLADFPSAFLLPYPLPDKIAPAGIP